MAKIDQMGLKLGKLGLKPASGKQGNHMANQILDFICVFEYLFICECNTALAIHTGVLQKRCRI